MPLHEYKCCGCGQIFEELIRTEEDELKLTCPKNCGSKQFTRLMSVTTHPKSSVKGSGQSGDFTFDVIESPATVHLSTGNQETTVLGVRVRCKHRKEKNN